MEILHTEKKDSKMMLYQALTMLALILCVVFIVMVFHMFRGGHGFGGKFSDGNQNVLTFTGHGEVHAVPDTASVYFTISKDAKTVKEAQSAVAEIEAKALEVLNTNGIDKKDIKTENASFSPKYEYKNAWAPCTEYGCPPHGGGNVVVGYSAYESISVKIKDIEKAGKIIQGLGTVGVTDLNGPNFTIDNEDALKAEARKLAIEDAKAKAESLAKDLGVSLGKLTSYNENGAYPVMYGKAMMTDSVMPAGAPAELPQGENTISSDVTITYEIR